jgi:hypothetical protein
MTTHEADRRADYDPIVENEELAGDDDPAVEQHEDADVADAEMVAPIEHEPETTESREHDARLDETDEPEGAEPDLVATDEADEAARPDLTDDADRVDEAAAERTPETDPVQKLTPLGADTVLDPGTGSYEDRWSAIQAGFIDDPRRTVESAGALVAEIWDDIARAITDEREGVDDRWQSAESSTDDFRVAMQDYRTLYTRFLRFTSD